MLEYLLRFLPSCCDSFLLSGFSREALSMNCDKRSQLQHPLALNPPATFSPLTRPEGMVGLGRGGFPLRLLSLIKQSMEGYRNIVTLVMSVLVEEPDIELSSNCNL